MSLIIESFREFIAAGGFWMLIPGIFLLVSVIGFSCWVFVLISEKRKNRKALEAHAVNNTEEAKENPPPVKVEHPMICYKTANLAGITLSEDDGNIVDISFKGLMGTEYGVQDSTTRDGHYKFNMYSKVSDALDHEQNWGSTFLEVAAHGIVDEHELGYTAQHQRVLQVMFLECSRMYAERIKCDNEPEYLARIGGDAERPELSGYKTYCAGCVKRFNDVRLLTPYYNRSFTLSGGNTIIVAGKSSREHVNFVPTVIGSSANNSIIASSVNDDADDDGVVR